MRAPSDSRVHLETDGETPRDALASSLPLSNELFEEILRRVTDIVQLAQTESEPDQSSGGDESLNQESVGELSLTPPLTAGETGLSSDLLKSLVLKWLVLRGGATLARLAADTRLAEPVLREVTAGGVAAGLVEMDAGGEQFHLSELGQQQAHAALQRCRYVGPAPVSLGQYLQVCRAQAPHHVRYSPEQLAGLLAPMAISVEFLNQLGGALSAGHSILLHGSSGNGKTELAFRLGNALRHFGGPILVPYAVAAGDEIVSVFDPTVHRPVTCVDTAVAEQDQRDERWRNVQRPLMKCPSTGPELYSFTRSSNHFFAAPLYIKANGGTLILDDLELQDFGPLARRWSRMLEEASDLANLGDQQSWPFPVEQLTIFASHLNPVDCVDAPFLRRVRSKVFCSPPTADQFHELCRKLCQNLGIQYDNASVSQFMSSHYNPQNPPKFSDPHNLLQGLRADCRFHGQSLRLTVELLARAARRTLPFRDSI